MGEINWTAEAESWLRDIYNYIAEDNQAAALRIVEGIYDCVQMLRQFPELGYRYEADQQRHIRILVYGHYRVPYVIRNDEDIDILGVFHGGLDINRYLL